MTPAVELDGIVKNYPGVRALAGVRLDLHAGEVHALVGENGAGKSTLIRIVSGDTQPDSGRICVNGRERALHSPAEARRCGIATIFQELMIVPELSVAENIMLGDEPTVGLGARFYSRRRSERVAESVLQSLGLAKAIDPRARVATLSIAQKQIVEIARALVRHTPVIVLDEPTASLSDNEADALLRMLRRLRDEGAAILYVSHRLDEIRDLADRITVLRGGRQIATLAAASVTTVQLIELMVGRPLDELFPVRKETRGEPVLTVHSLTRRGVFENVGFSVRSGEILGLAGLIGAGRTEVMRAIFGADPLDGGEVIKNGRTLAIRTPADAIAAGIAYLPEDRKEQGLVLTLQGDENLALAALARGNRFGLVSWRHLRRTAEAVAKRLQLRGDLQAPVRTFSGGNQQKVVIGKWVVSEADVLIFDEPTRGIDVGSKVEVYRLIHDLAERGAAIIFVSSELPELINLSHRIIVMSGGRVYDEMEAAEFDERRILTAAFAAHAATATAQEG